MLLEGESTTIIFHIPNQLMSCMVAFAPASAMFDYAQGGLACFCRMNRYIFPLHGTD
jgi:hypothetical protein